MTDIAALTAANAARWIAAKITRGPEFTAAAKRLVANKLRYLSVQARTGVPWFVVAVIHLRESNGDFNTQLGQGDPLGRISTHDPVGRGPFNGPNAWEDAAYDALVNCAPNAARNKDWSPGGTLTILERYNGLAYANHGVPSPYVWSGTDQYKSGKVLVDHGPIEPVVDVQLGCAGLLLAMQALDPSIAFAGEPKIVVPPPPDIHPPETPAPVNPIVAFITAIFNAIFKRGQ